MADFAPPTGPPPPRVPEGWKAVWNDQYKEWFYVNLVTKQTTWDKPTAPAVGHDDAPPGGPPPSYASGPTSSHGTDDKKGPLSSNNPYSATGSHPESDEALARRLQAEENSRRGGGGANTSTDRGASDSYYGSPQGQTQSQGQGQYGQGQYGQHQYGQTGQQQQPPGIQGGYPGAPSSTTPYQQSAQTDRGSGGFLGKLKNKFGGSGAPGAGYGGHGQQGGYPQQGYGQQYGGGYPQQQGYGGYPQQGYGGMGGGMMQPKKKAGMGVGGAAALGVGGGLLGGMLLADAMEDHDQNEYDQGYDDGGGGDDFGGGDF